MILLLLPFTSRWLTRHNKQIGEAADLLTWINLLPQRLTRFITSGIE